MKLRDGASGPSPPRSREITPSASLRPCPRPSLYEVVGVMRRYPSARGASSGPKSKRCVASSVVALSSVPAGPSMFVDCAHMDDVLRALRESEHRQSALAGRADELGCSAIDLTDMHTIDIGIGGTRPA